MPLLMCPNDNAAMQTLDRNGVQFDMCPSCRGVWLDRGELEKLMAASVEEGRASSPGPVAAPNPANNPASNPWSQPGQTYPPRSHHDHDRRRDEDYGYRKKKKRMDIFDIFD